MNIDRITLSVIVLSELYAGIRNESELKELDSFADAFPIYMVSKPIARSGGVLKQQYSKSHGVGLADALIAATATYHNLELKSLNVKHYPMFSQLAVIIHAISITSTYLIHFQRVEKIF